MLEAARLARAHDTRVVPQPRPARPLSQELLALVDLITPNQTEAELLTGVKVTDEATAAQAAARFHQMGIAGGDDHPGFPGGLFQQRDTTATYSRLSGQGGTPRQQATPSTVPCWRPSLAGADFHDAVRFAHGAAALSVTLFGAQSSIPSKQEVESFLLEQTAQGH